MQIQLFKSMLKSIRPKDKPTHAWLMIDHYYWVPEIDFTDEASRPTGQEPFMMRQNKAVQDPRPFATLALSSHLVWAGWVPLVAERMFCFVSLASLLHLGIVRQKCCDIDVGGVPCWVCPQ